MPSTPLRDLAIRACRVAADGCHRLRDGLGEVERLARFGHGRLEFSPRHDDIWVVTYPRSGTTWTLYLLHLLLERPAEFVHLDEVCPWFERSLSIGMHSAADLNRLPGPRLFKSHLLPDWTPRLGRFIYVRRNVADVARSYYALYRDYLGFRGDFGEFVVRLFEGRVQYGSWLTHTERWAQETERQVFHVDYERMRADPTAALRRIAAWLGLRHDHGTIARACDGASIEHMRERQPQFDHATAILRERGITPGAFIRRGNTHDPAQRLDDELTAELEQARRRTRPITPLRAFLR